MPIQIENTRLYDIQEVKTVIGKSESTVYRYIRNGEIETIRVGDNQLVDRAELERIAGELNFPPDIIEYRLGLKSPKAKSLDPQHS